MNNNFDMKEMHQFKLKELNKNYYNKYLNYLKIFYEKEHKKDRYIKDIVDNKLILIDKNNPKKKIEITPAKFININSLYIELKELCAIILFNINNLIQSNNNISDEQRTTFEELKNKYISYKKKIDDINEINNEYYNEIQSLVNEKIEKSNKLAKFYQFRHEIYSKITFFIKEEVKNKLFRYFKENKNRIPSQSIINKIAKDNKIPSDEIEKWFKWIENVYQYMIIQKEVNEIDKQIEIREIEFAELTKYMIVKKPVINE
jgi:hypothetical protein